MAPWFREKRFVVIRGATFTGKTHLANLLLMKCIAEFVDSFPPEAFQYFGQLDYLRFADVFTFTDTHFAVFDRPDKMLQTTRYADDRMQNILCNRYDKGLATIVVAGTDMSWFTNHAALAARFERGRQIFLV